ncbi:MAG: cysteine desulfurase [Treponema sp.]|nr:cysteine desulfurase [Treponema sp.]
MNTDRFYFDWAATALPDYSLNVDDIPFGNPSSLHTEGKLARKVLEDARSSCAQILGVPKDHLFFTSGGTESNSIVLNSLLLRPGNAGLLLSSIEHPSVREQGTIFKQMGKMIAWVNPNSSGHITPEQVQKSLDKFPDCRMLSIMWVNNETGAANDIPELVKVIRNRPGAPIHIHCDMVQGLGKIPCDIKSWDIDSASMSGHKIGAKRGIGMLYLKQKPRMLNTGGGQEQSIRPGTENLEGILNLAEAMKKYVSVNAVKDHFESASQRWEILIQALKHIDRAEIIPSCRTEHDPAFSPYILQVSFKDIPGEVMTRALDNAGFAVSTGSACSAASKKRPVLDAMGISEKQALEGIRISQGFSTSMEDIEKLIVAIQNITKIL